MTPRNKENDMGDKKTGTVVIGTQTAPITIGASPAFGTYTHNLGKKALRVSVVDPVNGAPILDASITVTQPDADTIVLTNTTVGILAAVVIADFEVSTPQNAAEVPASAVALA
jgi:hypothetical protein